MNPNGPIVVPLFWLVFSVLVTTWSFVNGQMVGICIGSFCAGANLIEAGYRAK